MLTIVCAILIAAFVIAAIPSVLAGVLWGFFAIFSKIERAAKAVDRWLPKAQP